MPRTINCPQCGKPALWDPHNPWRPFCSERCRLIDLGAWVSESYRIPVGEAPEDAASDKPQGQDQAP